MNDVKFSIIAKDKASLVLGKISTSATKMGNSFASAYAKTRKMNESLGNITKDSNRSRNSLGGLSKSLGVFNASSIVSTAVIYRLGNAIGNAINSTIEMNETVNLFSVSMGSLAEETNDTYTSLNKLTGLDLTNTQNAIGTFNLLAKSMGMADTQAQTLSTNTYNLALDLASLNNVSLNQAMQDLRSGLVGQSETVYKYGIDVTEAALKEEALAEGISKSVRNMTQGEKMALRYNVMLKQTSLAHGDFARTINSPANQLKVLSERIVTAGRALGSIFVPLLTAVLPYLNAFVAVLTEIFTRIATLFGYTAPKVKNTGSAIGSIAENADDVTDSVDGATKSVEKLKKSIMGFDELNIIQSPISDTGTSGGGEAGGYGGVGNIELDSYDSMLDTVKQKADKIAQSIKKVIAEFTDGIDFTKLSESFERYFKAIAPFSTGVAKGFFGFFRDMAKLALEIISVALPPYLDALSTVYEHLSEEDGEAIGKALGVIATAFLVFKAGGTVAKSINTMKESLTWIKTFATSTAGKIAIVITVSIVGFQIGKDLGKLLNPEDAGFYDEFAWSDFFNTISSDWSSAFDGLLLMASDFKENPIITTLFNGITGGLFLTIANIKDGFTNSKQDWNDFVSSISGFVGKIGGFLGQLSGDVVRTLVKIGVDIRGNLATICENITGAFNGIRNSISSIITGIIEWTGAKFGLIAGTVMGFKANIESNFWTMAFNINSAFSSIGSGFAGVFESLKTTAKNIINSIIGFFETGINSIVNGFNKLSSAKLPSKLGGGTLGISIPTLKLPRLAQGGIVDKATPLIAGEAGTEAIVPLENNTEWMDKMALKISQFNGNTNIKQAFKEAISESNFGETVLYLGTEEVARASNKGNKILDRRYRVVTE